jgi:hypothetical protein
MSIERVTITCTFYGQRMQNVMHFLNTDGFLTREQVANEIRDYWIGPGGGTGIVMIQPSNLVWVDVGVQTVSPSVSVPFHLAISKAGYMGANNEIPQQLAFILKLQTDTPGRAGRGRVYIPAPSNGFLTTGLIDTDLDYFLGTALTNLRTRFLFSSGVGPLAILVAPRNNPADYKKVTSLTFSRFPGIQRRRGVGFGI